MEGPAGQCTLGLHARCIADVLSFVPRHLPDHMIDASESEEEQLKSGVACCSCSKDILCSLPPAVVARSRQIEAQRDGSEVHMTVDAANIVSLVASSTVCVGCGGLVCQTCSLLVLCGLQHRGRVQGADDWCLRCAQQHIKCVQRAHL